MNDGPSSTETESQEAHLPWWKRFTNRLIGGPRTREDLKELLEGAQEDGLVDAEAARMIEGVFSTRDLQARDIMVPRAQMTCIEREWSLEKILAAVVESGHSRYPVIGDTRDEIVGILLAKDLLKFTTAAATFDLGRVMRPTVFVPDSKRVNVLLKDFKRNHQHMAVVADEYGGVSGLVTIEDILETIVGEIDDEHDEAEGAHIVKQDERRYLVNALTPIAEFNDQFESEFSDEEFDTIGGLVVAEFGHLPRRGESIKLDRFQFSVQRADSRRVQQLQVLLAQD
ncbi:MAG: transporter associated domain-containing protein [Pseudomonadota bacterium]